MNKSTVSLTLLMVNALLFSSCTFAASNPVWTFTPLTTPQFSLPINSSKTVIYRVRNVSSKPHTLNMKPILGVVQDSAGGYCAKSFTLYPQRSCLLKVRIFGDQVQGRSITHAPIVCQGSSGLLCYSPTAADSLNIDISEEVSYATLNADNSPLALAVVNGTGSLRITNTSTSGISAANVTSNLIGTALENKITQTSASSNCTLLPAGETCELGFTVQSSTTAAIPTTTIPITQTNTDGSITANIAVVAINTSYGGGVVGCLSGDPYMNFVVTGDDSPGRSISWGSNIVTGATSPDDGASNSLIILNAYANYTGEVAARNCDTWSATVDGVTYTDWVLPAKNQLYCLYTNNIGTGSSTFRWSSTEADIDSAWDVYFPSGILAASLKVNGDNIRCIRNLNS